MRRQMLSLALVLLSLPADARPQEARPPSARGLEEARTERLAGLARVWGAVKYFHPYLAYRDVDWDRALLETIPKVRAARGPQEYEAALNSMLAALGDSNTRARAARDKKTAGDGQQTQGQAPEPILLEDGVLTIDAVAVGKALAAANNRLTEPRGATRSSKPRLNSCSRGRRSRNSPARTYRRRPA